MTISILIMCGAFLELLFAIAFFYWLRSLKSSPLDLAQQHSTWIVLSVRGFDPSLERSISGLLEQDFTDYQVCVTVDHQADPAWQAIEKIKSSHAHGDRLTMRVLQNPLETCSLKCSALAEAVEFILNEHPKTERIVLVDSDVNAPPSMLAEVTGPLNDPNVGVVSGNQWFEPESGATVGTMVRSLWNAGALLLTVYFQNPWAGTFAMRAETIRNTDLINVWRKSAVDDGPIKALLQPLGLKSKVLPSLIMINRESCTFSFVQRWMARILTWSRIHEPSFMTTQFNVVVTDLLIIATIATMVWGGFVGHVSTVCWAFCALVVSGIFLVAAYAIIRRGVAQHSNSVPEGLPSLSIGRLVTMLFMILVAQWVYTFAVWKALTAKRVTWRGIDYSIHGRTLKMEGHSPYQANDGKSEVSI
jgi:hypothetical protein